ncbi:C-type lectin domain family 4 member E-like [Onychostoma macrolepis]|uniref:C-type lectin domain-containing protein n=1 Tax=Onychostoma macrolepis TaxID=369639 RepID=A0A7J6D571_9TELE|nr:C-type lectin domain family 4 member E-like [Onychostoma macrolepis]XP_058628939.1 C-type lectin domain family 4 member E-like [Onychostoma macrolepis]KAF4114205.1 hypothetical protein G5714_004428 [Onychostoma macrolepis]
MNKGSIMDSEDRIERTVDIYISAEAVRDMKHKKNTEDFNTTTTTTTTTRKPQHTGSDGVKIRSSRAAVVCLVLVCVLLLTAVIVLCVTFTQERNQLLTNNMNLTEERDQLKSEKNYHRKFSAGVCQFFSLNGGWKCHQSSLYLISSEKKSWTESRRYCTDRRADLIIINNTEEQDFVKNISGGDLVWIGLTDRDVEGRWKWVDGSDVTFRFWQPGEPNSFQGKEEDCAVNRSPGWADYPCDYSSKWICEKSIFK